MLMLVAGEPQSPMMLVEGGLTLVLAGLGYLWPQMGAGVAGRLERLGVRVAAYKGRSVLGVGLLAVLLRLALLPLVPIPLPFTPADFSNLLAADTFAHGRLSNPTPPMWEHFESIHITLHPSYMSMYFPASGLMMAFSKVLLGCEWFGILLSCGLFCSALVWMLQAWLPARWALLGGLLAVLRLGLFSYWINTYTGAGFLSALAGALMLGALPRLMRSGGQLRHGLLLALGIAIFVLTRPYEGLLLCMPTAAALAWWIVRSPRAPGWQVLLRRAVAPLLVVVAAISFLGYYDVKNFGKASVLPYTVDRATYATAPYFIWQQPKPEPHYNHLMLRRFYDENELQVYLKTRGGIKYLLTPVVKLVMVLRFFAGAALLLPLLLMVRALYDRRMRFLVVCLAVVAFGMGIEIFLVPHYVAAFTALFYVLGLQAMRHLRVWQPEGKPWGLSLARVSVLMCVLMAMLRLAAGPMGMMGHAWPSGQWTGSWYGPGHFGEERAALASQLESRPGQQLVLVRYGANHYPLNEWVYNSCEMDKAKVLWARSMSQTEDAALVQKFAGRTVWVVQPDEDPAHLHLYTSQPGIGQ